ncbi:MAG TPA: hypothetical protein DCQ26_08425 [Marinilabiliales bacterium]|jgi:tellurite resistance protein TerC|nr:MAG: hypothetical protein A2W95_08100 [Bacteroidetes bacterium GWA2_40_14]OFX63103.1 MAG: hypothetical protein A2W84_03405 [Bacteroidetes bacterium GWC2_40_13]OFX75751.1 MAG: hypothetical protein A2W96_09300 [Bacteroidetes bacterium GWD2_40_43]OFX94976.1 MAG: hypothetical protein A2W97_16540 [Bacteroidetes bacterium GWE2_40_63]OFY23488.1 MAG: hypothetical protein A2W88_08355 [Bacteroidetes bacterium GWF2_40_13]OFZ29386.1 MAG: hypothetical protein A2437_09245 [Bacteroidetes bacterium RIFOXYC
MFNIETLFLGGFLIFVVSVLLLDLLVIGRKSHMVSFKEAAGWTLVWITFALAFGVFLFFHGEKMHGIHSLDDLIRVASNYTPHLNLSGLGFEEALTMYRKTMAIDYLSGYLIEEILSIDNLFVIIMILTAFSVKPEAYKPVLFWGILGAIVLRFLFIFIGAALIHKFEWVLLIFGGYLVYAGAKMFIDRNKEEKIEPQNHPLVKFLSRYFRVFPKYVKNNFFVRRKKYTYITPLFIVLVMVEFTDLIFATDSIPAIFSVTRDPFVVFFSNIFAILGLRSMFFLLIHVVNKFHFLKIGISVLLIFVGIKLLAHTWLEAIGFKSVYSLYFILFVLVSSVLLSILFPAKEEKVVS